VTVGELRRVYNRDQRGATTEASAYFQQIHCSNRRDLDWLHRSTGYPLCALAISPSLSLASPTRPPAARVGGSDGQCGDLWVDSLVMFSRGPFKERSAFWLQVGFRASC
jgi:hypothetical protein